MENPSQSADDGEEAEIVAEVCPRDGGNPDPLGKRLHRLVPIRRREDGDWGM